jgi:hypothetical protein
MMKTIWVLLLASIQMAAVTASAAAASVPAAASQPTAPAGRFDRTLSLQGISFRVVCRNDSSLNELEIIPAGLQIDNRPLRSAIEGIVTGAEVADLNGDGSPEIYVYVTSVGSGSYGSLVAHSANRRKSLSQIYLPPITEHPSAAKGYMGHDEFRVAGSALVRRFPVYRPGDKNGAPTGGTRQVQYKLVPGEASWALRIDRVRTD